MVPMEETIEQLKQENVDSLFVLLYHIQTKYLQLKNKLTDGMICKHFPSVVRHELLFIANETNVRNQTYSADRWFAICKVRLRREGRRKIAENNKGKMTVDTFIEQIIKNQLFQSKKSNVQKNLSPVHHVIKKKRKYELKTKKPKKKKKKRKRKKKQEKVQEEESLEEESGEESGKELFEAGEELFNPKKEDTLKSDQQEEPVEDEIQQQQESNDLQSNEMQQEDEDLQSNEIQQQPNPFNLPSRTVSDDLQDMLFGLDTEDLIGEDIDVDRREYGPLRPEDVAFDVSLFADEALEKDSLQKDSLQKDLFKVIEDKKTTSPTSIQDLSQADFDQMFS